MPGKVKSVNITTHLVTHLVWPHEGPISMRPRALRTMQQEKKIVTGTTFSFVLCLFQVRPSP